ncbi:MAG: hypothetical protein JXR37_01785 [Kiritimatiellae bacterium]|nr:hypothetical protein [Kiritimatiellia bacterium]
MNNGTGVPDNSMQRTALRAAADAGRYMPLLDQGTGYFMGDFAARYRQGKELIGSILEQYQEKACQCAYPRFRQIVSMDCAATGDSYTCYDTEIFIDMARTYFDVFASELHDEIRNEKWVCKSCGSVYEYGWSDFSIHVSRQRLTPVRINTQDIGLPPEKPVPLFVGIVGHSCLPKNEVLEASYKQFKRYMQS